MKKNFSRREFLKLMGTATCGAAIHQLLTPAEQMMAFAAPVGSKAIINEPIMILLNLAGGASYNLAPPYNSSYRDRNPNISFDPEDSLPLSGEQGLHPSLAALKTVYDAGDLALLNLVGYPEPNRSHAESADIWFNGSRNGSAATGGWAARLTCQMSSVFSGISLGGSNLLTSGSCNPPLALSDLNNFGEDRFKWNDDHTEWLRMTRANVMQQGAAPVAGAHVLVKGAMESVERAVETVKKETSQDLPGIQSEFPNTSFGRACRDAASLVQARSLQTRFIYMAHGGFDTHSGERSRLSSLLGSINSGLEPLIETLKAIGRWDDTVIVTMSEFSRSFENGSEGTDHGHAAPMLIMGGRVNGGIKTPTPTIANAGGHSYFHDYHVDFRQVFREVVYAMGYDVNAVLPEVASNIPLGLF